MDRILIVEDEEKLARFLELELAHEGYAVEKAFDGRTGLDLAENGGFDLILLDVMLPGMSGLEVLRRLRRTDAVPVIVLTARDAVMDKVTGLDMGANDYITKPFEIEELLARIRAALRSGGHSDPASSGVLVSGGLTLDPARRTLMRNRGIVMTREKLLEQVWGYDYAGETNVVDVYIRYLRQKIDDAFGVKLIHTVRGVGYAFRDAEGR